MRSFSPQGGFQLLGAAAHLIFQKNGRLEEAEIGPLEDGAAFGPVHQDLHDLVEPGDLGK